MAEIEFKLDDQKVKQWFEKLRKNKDKITQRDSAYVGVIAVEVYRDVIRHFEKEQGSQGPWKKWSSSYQASIEGRVAFRKMNGRTVPLGPDQIKAMGIKPPRSQGQKLQVTGALRNNFRAGQWRTVRGGVEWYNPAKTKSGFPYAAAHDIGGEKLPRRDFMWLSDSAMEKVAELTLNFFADE